MKTYSRTRTRGQSLTELALVLPLLLLLVLAAVDYGRVFLCFQQVESAAAAGAQFGCLNFANATNTVLISSHALNQASNISNLSPAVTSTCANTNVSVTVSATFRPFVAWPWLPTNVPIRRTVSMLVLD
ncbi:MAG: pilus assembly protein [Verrucomicrobia bacterium]|nr:pilus assembly protein [Verrucomicrobiota bacterium]